MTSAGAGWVAAAVLAACPVVSAGAGDLDASFGDGGRVFVDTPNDTDVAAGVILQADGKLVIGRANDSAADDFSILRLNADGSPDTSFGRNGRTALDYAGIKGTTRVVLQQSDGRLVAAGTAGLGSFNTSFGLARYNGDGSVDTGFGVNGAVIHELGGQSDGINAIVEQADGRLVAAGYAYEGSGGVSDMALARFNADGSLDASFGTNGSVIVNFHEGNGPDEVQWLMQQADGKLLAVGTAWPSNPASSGDIGVLRLSPDGLPDITFDGDGRAAVNVQPSSRSWGSYFLTAAAVALQPDGRILLAGSTDYTVWDYGGCLPALTRLNTDGSVDTSFGDSGAMLVFIEPCASFEGIVMEPNGDLYFPGSLYAYNTDLFVVRVTASGDLDTSYGPGGVAIVDAGDGNNTASILYGSPDIVRQPDGRIVTVAATSIGDPGSGDTRLVIARLLADDNHPGVLGFRSVSYDFAGPEGTLRVEPENVGIAEIPVRRTGGSSGAVSVDYEAVSGSAESGTDFTGTAGTLTWADNETSDKIISVSIADDTEVEQHERFKLILSNPSGDASLATTELTFEIRDVESHSPGPSPGPAPASQGGGGAASGETLIALAVWWFRILWRRRQAFRVS